MNLPPTYWQQALREWAKERQELARTQLRLVIVGGDRLEAQGVRQWRDLGLRGVRLLNAYGPTETTITATLGEVGEEERITIGRPLPGRSVYILDRRCRPAPTGVVGELHIGGELLARGYLNQPELTRQRFMRDPFGAQPEAGCTGPVTWRAICPTGASSTWDERTSRSRSAAIASSWERWRRRWPSTRPSRRRWCWRRVPAPTRSWWPTWQGGLPSR